MFHLKLKPRPPSYPGFVTFSKNYSAYVVGQAPETCNPVGTYRKTFSVDPSWDGKEIFINFEGVESAMYLYVNGEYLETTQSIEFTKME